MKKYYELMLYDEHPNTFICFQNTELLYEGPVDVINVDLEMENESRTSTPSTSTSLRKRKRIHEDDTASLLTSAVSALNRQSNKPVDSLEAFGQLVYNMVQI